MDKKTFTYLISLFFFILSSAPVFAEPEQLPISLSIQDAQFNRCSRGQLKAFRFFHVGYAGLYLQNCQQPITIFDNSAKRLRFVYQREIPARAFREAAEEYLLANLGPDFTVWQEQIKQFNKGYRDIKEGDYYDLIYNAQTGLKLNLNDTPLATMEDPQLGLAYFNIWFGKEPFSEKLKEQLLTPE